MARALTRDMLEGSGETGTVTKPSVCPLDCPDTCSLSVEVEDGRIVKVRGSRANPFTAGAICSKVSNYYPDFVHGPRRLTRPLARTGPRGSHQFRAISWEEALERVHAGISAAIDRHGPQSVLPFNYAGPHGQLAGGSMDRRFFHRLGASLLDRGPLCGAVRGTAYTSVFGDSPGMPPEQAAHADLIVVVSNNVTVSNLHLARVIKSARRKGAKLVVVDPRRTKIAEQADLFLQIEPGTDVLLWQALAAELERRGGFDGDFIERWVAGFEPYMAAARRVSLERAAETCRLPRADLERLIELYLGAERVAMSIGNGLERGRNGGGSIRAAIALQALTGNLGRKGAGVVAKPGLAFPATTARLQRPDLVPEGTRTINIVDVAEKLLDESLDPPLAAVFIYNHNPVCTHPDQNRMREALSREDLFVVGCDVAMTDSLLYADVILPAASHFEFPDVYAAYGQAWLQRAEPVIPPVGESLPNTEIFRRLAARFGFDEPAFEDDDAALMDAAYDAEDPRLQGFRPSELPLDKAIAMKAPGGEELVMCASVFPKTPSGKVELVSEALERAWGAGIPAYRDIGREHPLTLVSPSSDKRTNATFGGHPDSGALEVLEIHPEDARPRGIVTGETVRVWNRGGEVALSALVTDRVKPGTVYSPKGTWLHASPTGQTVNALIPAEVRADICRGACYNDTYVEVAVF